jgi:hypothetical protein
VAALEQNPSYVAMNVRSFAFFKIRSSAIATGAGNTNRRPNSPRSVARGAAVTPRTPKTQTSQVPQVLAALSNDNVHTQFQALTGRKNQVIDMMIIEATSNHHQPRIGFPQIALNLITIPAQNFTLPDERACLSAPITKRSPPPLSRQLTSRLRGLRNSRSSRTGAWYGTHLDISNT